MGDAHWFLEEAKDADGREELVQVVVHRSFLLRVARREHIGVQGLGVVFLESARGGRVLRGQLSARSELKEKEEGGPYGGSLSSSYLLRYLYRTSKKMPSGMRQRRKKTTGKLSCRRARRGASSQATGRTKASVSLRALTARLETAVSRKDGPGMSNSS